MTNRRPNGTRYDGRNEGLRVLAVDDEPPALDDLLHLLREDRRILRADGVTDATKALRHVHKTFDDAEPLDAVFLDVRMPGLNGMDLARVLARFAQSPAIVFVTAHETQAVEAFELKAVDYILKPVRAARLTDAISRIIDLSGRAVDPQPTTSTVPEIVEPSGDAANETIPVELGGVTRFVRLSDILYVEAQRDYARLHCASDSYLLRIPLSILEERWAEAGFMRIHRGYLVAIRHIEELRLDGGQMTMRVGTQTLPVSRRHAPQVRDVLVARARPKVPRTPSP